MAEYLKTLKCGGKTYYVSHSGSDVYYNSSSKTGGFTLKGAKFVSNEIKVNGKPASDFDLCQAIAKL